MDKKNPLKQNQSTELVSLAEREALLRLHLGSFGLSVSDMAILVSAMRELTINPGDVIVTEGDMIESIYLLAAGSTEVSRNVIVNNRTETMLLATLFEGDAIGLKGDQLFSETGFRTATITALTPSILLELPLSDFHVFLESRPELLAAIRSKSDWILRMKLIKAATPFAKLNHQQLAGLASGVKEIKLKPYHELFKQGETAENCYLICSGQVEVSICGEQGEPALSILEPYELVGEAAFLNFARYNATARTLTECTLLQMDKELLLEVASGDHDIHDTLITLSKGHCRPIRQEHIIYHHRTTADGQSITSLKNTATNRYLQLSKEGWLIWTHLNGNLSISELAKQIVKEDSGISPDEVKTIIQKLINAGFALIDVHESPHNEITPVEQKNSLMNRLFNSRYFFQKADKKINFLYQHGGFVLFNILSIFVLLLFTITGSSLFFKVLPQVADSIKSTNHLFYLLFLVMFLSMTMQLVTPLIKALTIKHFNQEVPLLGVVWRLIGPVGIVDTSDMWLSSRRGQIAVSLSGILCNFVLASLFSSYAYYTNNPDTMVMSWLCALLIFFKTIRTLNPLLDLDGYESLCNILDCPRLRERSLGFLSQQSNKVKTHQLEIIFWSYTLFYLLSLMAVVAFILNAFFVNQPVFSALKSFIFILFPLGFFIEIILEIKNYRQLNSRQIL